MKLKSLSFDQLYDIRALQVLVHNNADCYHVLGLVHGLWRYIPNSLMTISPTQNQWLSLATYRGDCWEQIVEVQNCTFDMHYEVELACVYTSTTKMYQNKKDDYLTKKSAHCVSYCSIKKMLTIMTVKILY